MATKVYVINMGRPFYYLQWDCPTTGKRITRTSKCKTRRDAERKAAELERELDAKGVIPKGQAGWVAFCNEYGTQHLGSLAIRSEQKSLGVLAVYSKLMTPRTLGDVNTAALSQYAAKLRDAGRSEATIASHLGAMRAALNWGRAQGYIDVTPQLPTLARNPSGRLMRGRPLSIAEFAMMLRATRAIVGKPAAKSWRRFLRGLWLSGLRLKESLSLSWDDETQMRIDLSGRFPMLAVVLEHEKGHRDRLLPLTPDFAEWLLRTPPQLRTGPVFNPIGDRGAPVRGDDYVGGIISAIGREAGVIVDQRRKKYASAHDLRRTFGTRWARRVTPQLLKELMRHQDISTTERYYVSLNAELTAEDLWKNWGGQQNSQHSPPHP